MGGQVGTQAPGLLVRILSRGALTVAGAVAGLGIGVLILKLRPQSGMGFDGIGDALAAVFLGAGGGAVGGLVASLLLSVRATWLAAGATALLGIPLLLASGRMEQNRPPTPEPVAPFEPTFVVQMFSRIAPADPGPPAGIASTTGGHPYRELRVSAVDRTFSSKGWGKAEGRSYCAGPLEESELASLAPLAQALHEKFGVAGGVENCSIAGAAPFSLTVDWTGETRGVVGFSFECGEPPEVQAFLGTFDAVRARFVGEGACR